MNMKGTSIKNNTKISTKFGNQINAKAVQTLR